MATSRCYYGAVLLVTGEVDRGAEMARLGGRSREPGWPSTRWSAESLSVLAIAHAVAGDFDDEREMHVARLAVAREHGDVARTADALGSLAEIALDEADAPPRARTPRRRGHREPDAADGGARALAVSWRARTSSRRPLLRGDDPRAGVRGGREDRADGSMLAQCYRVAGAGRGARQRGGGGPAVRRRAAARAVPSGTDDPVEADLPGVWRRPGPASAGDGVEREWTLGTSLPAARGCSDPAAPTSTSAVPRLKPGRQDGRERLPSWESRGAGGADATIDRSMLGGTLAALVASGIVVLAAPQTVSALPAAAPGCDQRAHVHRPSGGDVWETAGELDSLGVPDASNAVACVPANKTVTAARASGRVNQLHLERDRRSTSRRATSCSFDGTTPRLPS